MAESRQLSVRLSEETFAALEALKPDGTSLAEVARRVLEKALRTGLDQLPPLPPTVVATVDLSPILAAIDGLQLRQDEVQRETLRAVNEHGSWSRLRFPLPEDRSRMKMGQDARDDGEELTRAWERSVGR